MKRATSDWVHCVTLIVGFCETSFQIVNFRKTYFWFLRIYAS